MSQQNSASGDGDEPRTGPAGTTSPVHGWWQRLSSWQRIALPAGILTLVIAVIAAAVLNSGGASDDSRATARDLQPFRAAVDELAEAPGLRYKDTSTLGITENDITVTADGSQFGTTSSGRSDSGRDVLRIGGKKFTRWQVDPAPREDAAAGEKAPPSEWIVGLDDGSELMDEALGRTIAPSKLAAVLDKALADLEKSPPPAANGSTAPGGSGQRPLSVNGTPALGIDTSAGRLLVTKEKPHRVLRLEAYDLRDGLADMRDQLESGETPSAPRTVTTGPLASGGAERMDLTPVLADAADKMFDTLVEYADQLEDATDRGITFTLDGAGEMDCSPNGCTATQNFTGEVTSVARRERVTKGEVSAVMSATFSIDGKSAGECTSPQRTFPVRGNTVSGTLKCSNPGAGPLYASVAARVQAQAQADADRCGCKVRLTYPLRANTLIDARALAEVEARELADRARRERGAAQCGTPGGSSRIGSARENGGVGSRAFYTGTGEAQLFADDRLVTVYHYTDKKGYKAISACKPYFIKPGKSKNGPGPFFTNRSPADLSAPGAFKKDLGITKEKSQYVMEFQVQKNAYKKLRGDRGEFIFIIPGGATVDRAKVRYFGPTSGWKAP